MGRGRRYRAARRLEPAVVASRGGGCVGAASIRLEPLRRDAAPGLAERGYACGGGAPRDGHAALSRAEAEDAALSRVAAGAAALACHQMGLAIAADAAEDHPLALKYRLFAGGRWLLGVMGDRCYLF